MDTQIRVILTTGVPACGKSTWAEGPGQLFGFNELNLDKLREELSGDATNQAATMAAVQVRNQRLEELLAKGHKVILSDTNADPKFRALLIEQCLQWVRPEQVSILHFPIDLQEAKARNAKRVNPVPDPVMARMHAALEACPPSADADRFGLIYAEYTQRVLA